ncbi:MAG: hypothetical protein KAR40_08795 [Candidatus Sabulitectum sp.]|nr:hypothetical protein [Candidatus Sabulitectum sp.]
METPDVSFVSFGDANGNRQDLFRFIKQVNPCLNEVTANRNLNLSYIHILEKQNRNLTQLCADVVKKVIGCGKSISSFSDEEKDALKFLEQLRYVESDESGAVRITVPLFDAAADAVIGEISSYLMEIIKNEVADEFSNLKGRMRGSTSVLHGIDEKEIANELWHQVFGNINEYLVREGLFPVPEHRIDEGRYFQALYVR